jgi:nicotinamidase/pyrazinamidase
MKKNNKVLFRIDVEYDFLDGGKLGVEGSKEKFDKMPAFLYNKGKEYISIWDSADFHPITHCSFKVNGGIWPVHCQEFTMGASIYQPIVDAVNDLGIDHHVFTKGTNEDREEYSVMRNEKSNKEIHALIEALGVTEVDFCGIAGDYCVKDSIEDFHREFPNIKINVLMPFVASIDGGKTFDEFIANSDYITRIDEV